MLFHRSDKRDRRVSETPPHAMDYPKDVDKAPDEAGVFMLIDSSDEVVYVGKAIRSFRDEIKAKDGQDAIKGATKFRWFSTKSDVVATDLEEDWIEKYQPRNNERVAELDIA